MQKFFIKNRKAQKISVVVEEPSGNPKGLAFVMHGLGGFKEQPHIRAMIESFLENGYVTVSFDTTNTIGESEGKYEDATITNYFEDLEDVIAWAHGQDWYTEPFILVGHSLGGICVALYAEKNSNKVKALAPISTVVSGKLSTETKDYRDAENWKRTGWFVRESGSKPGVFLRLPWSHMEDRLKYDLLSEVGNLKMPVLIMSGRLDKPTPVEHQRILFEKLPGPKEMHVIDGADHNFRPQDKNLFKLKRILDQWIKKLD